MTQHVSSTAPTDSGAAVPVPRVRSSGAEAHAARHAREGLAAVYQPTVTLRELVGTMDDAAMRGPSALPDWTRGHVVSHLARNADGLLNLLIWARTGVEHPMYASRADRDADINEGAQRMRQVQQEDLGAACDRFAGAAERLSDSAWAASVGPHRHGRELTAYEVPWLRLVEVLVHLVDLNVGVDFDQAAALAGEHTGTVFDYVLRGYAGRSDVPSVRLDITLPSGEARSWTLGDVAERTVGGSAGSMLAWLTGRTAGEGLVGDVPALPAWM